KAPGMKGYLLAAAFAALILGGVLGYAKGAHDSDQSAKVDKLQAALDSLGASYKQANDQLEDFKRRQGELTAAAGDITKRLADAHDENERLRALLAAGDVGVYVDAVCEFPGSAESSDPGRGDGGRCRLTRRGEQNYVGLLNAIDRKQ